MSTVESYLAPSIRRQPSAAPEQSAAVQSQTYTDTDIVDVDGAEDTTSDRVVEVVAAPARRINRSAFHQFATLASLVLCAAALWGLAWQSAQIARLNLVDSRLQTQVGVTQSTNLDLHDEITRLTNTTRILRIAKALHLRPSVVVQLPVHG